jgi:AAHS family 3-hydroxyphenylpropionic acid transporter
MLNWLPLLLQARGLTKPEAALALVGFNLGGAVAALAVGWLLDTGWRRPAVALCAVALPAALMILAGPPTIGVLTLALAISLGGGVLGCQVILYGVAGALYEPATRGTGLGAAVGVGRFGSIIGPALAGVLLAAGRSSQQVLAGLLPIVALVSLCVLLLALRRSPAATQY